MEQKKYFNFPIKENGTAEQLFQVFKKMEACVRKNKFTEWRVNYVRTSYETGLFSKKIEIELENVQNNGTERKVLETEKLIVEEYPHLFAAF